MQTDHRALKKSSPLRAGQLFITDSNQSVSRTLSPLSVCPSLGLFISSYLFLAERPASLCLSSCGSFCDGECICCSGQSHLLYLKTFAHFCLAGIKLCIKEDDYETVCVHLKGEKNTLLICDLYWIYECVSLL